MVHLTHRDLQKVQDCIRDIYSSMDIKSMPARIVSAVSRIIPSSIILYAKYSYGKIVENHKAVCVEEVASLGNFEQMDALARHAHEHPFINMLHFQRSRPHPFREDIERAWRKQPLELSAVKISDVLKDHQFHSLALFNEFFRPQRNFFYIRMRRRRRDTAQKYFGNSGGIGRPKNRTDIVPAPDIVTDYEYFFFHDSKKCNRSQAIAVYRSHFYFYKISLDITCF